LGPAARTFQMFGANVIVQMNSAGAGHLQSPKTDDSLPGMSRFRAHRASK
jgi:hypothetical protein